MLRTSFAADKEKQAGIEFARILRFGGQCNDGVSESEFQPWFVKSVNTTIHPNACIREEHAP
jgi:hypothetical protein